MDVRVGVLFLFVLAASWACDARQLTNLDLSVSKSGHLVETQTFQAEEVVGNEKACTLCEEFAGQALDYIGENKTQTEIVEYLHQTCSQLRSFKQQRAANSDPGDGGAPGRVTGHGQVGSCGAKQSLRGTCTVGSLR
ncbi:hypothetical protein ACFX13_033795 [Malus domestica]|nr:uncharacterized protein LOC114824416 [Malus domestica]